MPSVPREKYPEMNWRAADKVATWKLFKWRMNVIFVADQVPEERQWALILVAGGDEAYNCWDTLEETVKDRKKVDQVWDAFGKSFEQSTSFWHFRDTYLGRLQTRWIGDNGWPGSPHQADCQGVPMEEGKLRRSERSTCCTMPPSTMRYVSSYKSQNLPHWCMRWSLKRQRLMSVMFLSTKTIKSSHRGSKTVHLPTIIHCYLLMHCLKDGPVATVIIANVVANVANLMSKATAPRMRKLVKSARVLIISKSFVVPRLQPGRRRALTKARSHSRRGHGSTGSYSGQGKGGGNHQHQKKKTPKKPPKQKAYAVKFKNLVPSGVTTTSGGEREKQGNVSSKTGPFQDRKRKVCTTGFLALQFIVKCLKAPTDQPCSIILVRFGKGAMWQQGTKDQKASSFNWIRNPISERKAVISGPVHKIRQAALRRNRRQPKTVTSGKAHVPSPRMHNFEDAKIQAGKRATGVRPGRDVDVSGRGAAQPRGVICGQLEKEPKTSKSGNSVPSGPNKNITDSVKDGPFSNQTADNSNAKSGPKMKHASKKAPCRKYYKPSNDTKTFQDQQQRSTSSVYKTPTSYTSQMTKANCQAAGKHQSTMNQGECHARPWRIWRKLYPNSFDRLGSLKGAYNIRVGPYSQAQQTHARRKVPIESKEAIGQGTGLSDRRGNHHGASRTNTVGLFSDIPEETKWER